MTITTARSSKARALKLGIASVAAAALVLGGMTSAHAADFQLGPDDIVGFENGDENDADYNYDQWHVGSVYNSGLDSAASLDFGDCSVTTLAVPADSQAPATVTQVLKGFPIDGRPTADAANGVSDVQALLESISIDVAEGQVTLQLPFFAYDVDPNNPEFTTVRNAQPFGPGVSTLEGVELTDSSAWGNVDDYEELLEELQFGIDQGDSFEILGVGFTGSPGAEVNSISFGGDTYHFGTGDCLPGSDDDDDNVDDQDDADTPAGPRPPERVDTGL